MQNIVTWLRSPQGQDFRLVLDVSVAILVFLWLLKNHKIIQNKPLI